MRKLLILSIACLMGISAMAQTIDAIKVTQGETIDWYPFGESDRIDVTITNGNPEFPNKTYDLANGNVETAFDTDPLPVIKEAAIAEIKGAAEEAKEEIDGLGVDESAKSEAKADIDNIVNTAKQTINAATSEDEIDDAKTEAIAQIYNVVQNLKDMWIPVRENMTIGNYGTLCWKYNLTAIEGAELYTIAGKENNRIILEEVKVEETQAGAGYVILATAGTLRVKNGNQQTDTPLDAAACNGLQGTFAEIVDGATGAAGNTLEGKYIVYNNEWRLCGGYTGLRANRAYLILDAIPNKVPIKAPNRKYISMPLPGGTPTGFGQWNKDKGQKTYKVIENGQFRIVKDNKMYNAQGIEL